MDTGLENPERRKFKLKPIKMVTENRGKYVAAVLTIILAYKAASSPKQDGVPLAGYEEWCSWVRDPLLWLGEADPVAVMDDTKANDPQRELVSEIMVQWEQLIGLDGAHTAAEIAAKAGAARYGEKPWPGLYNALNAVAAPGARGDGIDPRRLGTWLGRYKDRVVNRRRIKKLPLLDGYARWSLERVEAEPAGMEDVRW
jgi:putative DNA primase/helicase